MTDRLAEAFTKKFEQMEEEFQKDRFSVISMSELMNEDSKEERDRKRKQILEEEAEESDEGNPLGELAAEMDQD